VRDRLAEQAKRALKRRVRDAHNPKSNGSAYQIEEIEQIRAELTHTTG